MALAVPGSPQRRASIFKRGVTTTLHGPNDLSTEIALGQRETLAEEVKEACRKLGVQSDGPLEESFLFTVGSGAAAVIVTKAELSRYLEKGKIHLRKVPEVATCLVAALEASSETAREKAYLQLLNAAKNEYLLDEVISKRNGLQVALREVQATQCSKRPPLAAACAMLNDDNAEDWLDERQDCKELGIGLFRHLLVSIFAEDAADTSIRHLCLSLVISLLQKLPSLAEVVNQVIREEKEKEENGGDSMVAVHLNALEEEEDCEVSFQYCAANLLLASLAESQDERKLQEERFDQLLVAYTGACTELASAAVHGTSSSAPEELEKLQRRIEHLQGRNRQLESQVRLKWAAMIKMAKFVYVDDDVIDKSLESVIRNGWDAFKWNRGYSLLHYAAECVQDPQVVELVANLATNVDQKDGNGKRPIDYARKMNNEEVIAALERMRKAARRLAQEADKSENVERDMEEPVMKEHQLLKEPKSEEKAPRSPRSPRTSPRSPRGEAKEELSAELKAPKTSDAKDVPRSRAEGSAKLKVQIREEHEDRSAASPDQSPQDRSAASPDLSPLSPQAAARQPDGAARRRSVNDSTTRRQSVNHEAVVAAAREKLKNATDMKPALSKAVASVLNKGWDGVSWPSNFSAVHVAAKIGDVTAIDILAEVGADLALQDQWKLTPIDYAAQSGNHEVVAALQRHLAKAAEEQAARKAQEEMAPSPRSQEPARSPQGSKGEAKEEMASGRAQGSKVREDRPQTSSSPDVSPQATATARRRSVNDSTTRRQSVNHEAVVAAAKEKLKNATDMKPALSKAVASVLNKGWDGIAWPSNFSAMHVAAKLGDVTAIDILAEVGADLALQDQWNLTPIDYAAQSGNQAAVEALQRHLAKAAEQAAEQAPPDMDDMPPVMEELPVGQGMSSIVRGGVPGGFAGGVPGGVPGAVGGIPGGTAGYGGRQGGSGRVPGIAGGLPADVPGVVHGSMEESQDTGSRHEGGKFKSAAHQVHVQRKTLTNLSLSKEAGFDRLADLRRENEYLKKDLEQLRSGTSGLQGLKAASPLSEDMLRKYLKELDVFGRDKVFEKLQDSTMAGGQDLSLNDAEAAMAQLEMILRLASVAKVQALPEETPAETPPAAQGKGKGKGPKGPAKGGAGAAPAEGKAAEDTDGTVPEVKAEEKPAEEAAETSAAPKAKGKAKGKGPPKGKPAAEEAKEAKEESKEEAKAEETPAPKGKGPKGPAKGKGPPAPAGKGPPAPAGKGPAPPAGKGPGAPAAKGGAGKGGKAGGKGGKGGAASAETKPAVKPEKPMKPLWWSKMLFGAQLKKGETIWDEVKDDMDKLPLEELTERFSKSAVAKEKPKKEKEEGKKEELKSLRIITDPQIVVGKEASLKKLPEPSEVARALNELDDSVLDMELLQVVKDNACPTPPQMKEMDEIRQKNPNVPFALPESFMWVIGKMPAYQQRIDCWCFAMSYKEQHASYHTALTDFLQVVECFQESEMLPCLLGIILAVGNFLNGGTNRGQADGFDIESLAKLEGIKDATGKDIRHFIFDLFLNRMNEQSSQFMEEIMPCMVNMNRRISKDSDGVEKLDKSAKIAFEDFDLCVTALHSDFVAKHEMMQMILSYFEDPADPFKMQMPKIYSEAKEKLDELLSLKDTAKEKYGQLLKWFKIQAMKSNEFCVLWDNLLIPANLILNADMKMKKEFMLPAFCQNKAVSSDDLQILWSFKEFDGKRTVKKKTRAKARRRFSQRLRDGAAAAAAAESAASAGAEAAPAAGGKSKGKAKGGKGAKGAPGSAAPAEPAPASEAAPTAEAGAETAAPAGKGPKGKSKGKGPAKGAAAAAPVAEPAAEKLEATEASATTAEAGAEAAPAAAGKGPKGKAKGGKGPAKGPGSAAAPAEPAAEKLEEPKPVPSESMETPAPAEAAPTAEAGAEAAAPAAGKGPKGKAKGGKGPAKGPAAAAPAEPAAEKLEEPKPVPSESMETPAPAEAAPTAEAGAEAAAPAAGKGPKGKAKGGKGPAKGPAAAAPAAEPAAEKLEEPKPVPSESMETPAPAEAAPTAEAGAEAAAPAAGKGPKGKATGKGAKGPAAPPAEKLEEPQPAPVESAEVATESSAAPGKGGKKGPKGPSKGVPKAAPAEASLQLNLNVERSAVKFADAPLDEPDLSPSMSSSQQSPTSRGSMAGDLPAGSRPRRRQLSHLHRHSSVLDNGP